MGGGASNWREVRKLLLLPDSRNSQRAHHTAQSFDHLTNFSSHYVSRVTCHVSRVKRHAASGMASLKCPAVQHGPTKACSAGTTPSWAASLRTTRARRMQLPALSLARFLCTFCTRASVARLCPHACAPVLTAKPRRYYSWKHSEMLRLGCGGWVTETGDSQLPLLDSWQVQPHASPMIDRIA